MPTAKQKQAQAKFKKKVAEAKRIKARHPNMKFSTAVKIAYGKQQEPKCKTKRCKGNTKRRKK